MSMAMIRELVDQTVCDADTQQPGEREKALDRIDKAFRVMLNAVDGVAFEDSHVAVLNHTQLTEEMLHALGGERG